jgi:hypothetical protein
MGLGDKAQEMAEKVKEALTRDDESPEEQSDADVTPAERLREADADLTPAERLREAQWEVDHAVQIDDKR